MTRFGMKMTEILSSITDLALLYGVLALPFYLLMADRIPIDEGAGHTAVQYTFAGSTGALWLLTIVLIPYWGAFLLRQVIKNFWIALIFHLFLPVIAFYVVSDTLLQIFWIAAMIILSAHSLSHYYRDELSSGIGKITIYNSKNWRNL